MPWYKKWPNLILNIFFGKYKNMYEYKVYFDSITQKTI